MHVCFTRVEQHFHKERVNADSIKNLQVYVFMQHVYTTHLSYYNYIYHEQEDHLKL